MKLTKKHKAYILLIYAFLVFIHFILKDRIYPISILYYAFPLIILILLGLIIAFLNIKRKSAFILIISFQALLSVIWFKNYFSFSGIESDKKLNQSILFWNVAKKEQIPVKIIIEKVKTNSIENIALVEAENISKSDIESLKENLKNYNFKVLKGSMFFGTKNEIKSLEYLSKEKEYNVNIIETINQNEIYKFLITDIYASPFSSRKKPLNSVFNLIKDNSIDIVVGDFNTPFNSIHFNNYKKKLNSFHKLSKGTTATWAYGFPLMELDHIWLNQRFKPNQLKKFNYKLSDHQLLIAEYFKSK